MGFMAYAPLGRGLLTGRFRTAKDLPDGDRRRQFPRFQAENIEKNVQILSRLRDLATEKGISLASLSLAWLLHRGDDIIPIPSSKTREHLEDNLRALAVALTEEDLSRIEEICPPGAAAGTRYPAKQMLRVNA
jgi:aryl-alcohol dehydrogenase-like predicted oxidoreductase